MSEKTHRCSYLSKIRNSISIEKIEDEESEPYWALVSEWIAGEEEVIDGEADFVGETLSSTQILIYYCPFCAEKLL